MVERLHGISIRFTSSALFFLILFIPAKSRADHVFLTDGKIIKGIVLSQTATTVTMKTENGSVVTYDGKKIMRVLYTELYMGQQYIRLTDGRVIQAYMVDEDRTSYTFREEIDKPKEFTIPREKVLFVSRKTPNELVGTTDYTSADINWKAPLGTTKYYNIYITEKFKQYPKKPAAQTTNLQYVIRDLKSATDYNIIVTAVDDRDIESLPSNEINISTKNYPPEAPHQPRCLMVNEWRGKKLQAHLKWNVVPDRDGMIQSYTIYLCRQGEKSFELVDTLKVPDDMLKANSIEYILVNLADKKEYSVMIKAIDNKNADSPFSPALTFTTLNSPPNAIVQVFGAKEKYFGGGRVNVKLAWEETGDPDGIIKEYRVYEKTHKGFNLIGISPGNEYMVKGLAVDKDYVLEVRAVDNRGVESDKNKEFKISTYNDPPDPPNDLKTEKNFSPDKKKLSIALSWGEADDPDGLVTGYRIYEQSGGKLKLVAETRVPKFNLINLDPGRSYSFVIKSVDNRGVESDVNGVRSKNRQAKKTGMKEVSRKGVNITGRVTMLAPIREFAKMYTLGYGGIISARFDGLGKKNFFAGLDLGCYYFPGKGNLFVYSMMIPAYAVCGYKFRITDFFMISPEAGFGGAYIVNKNDPDNAALYDTGKSTSGFEPVFFAGLQINFLILKNMVINAGVDYSATIEKKGLMDFIAVYAEIGYRL